MNDLLDVVKVKAHPDYSLELEFENGERRRFDMAPLLDKKLGGFKSEVQHLPCRKVCRCQTAPEPTTNSNRKTS
jgi:hypothetical protein